MNTPLFLLRAYQLGLSVFDLEQLDYGMVLDMITESGNDSVKYREVAGQSDFDKF